MAKKILSQLVTRARRMARVTDSTHDNQDVTDLINEGQREFAKEAFGLWAEDYLTLKPWFDGRTNMAIGVRTDWGSASFAITATNFTDASGTTVAGYLTTAIQSATSDAASFATSSIYWDASNWYFVIETASATRIEVFAPTYTQWIDYTDALFGKSGTQTASTWVGGQPEDALIEASLPSGYLSMEHVEWDKNPVYPAPFDVFISPEQTSSNPYYWGVKNKKIRLYPEPTEQKLLHIWYREMPTEFGEYSTSMSASSYMDLEYEMAPIHYAAAKMAEDNMEYGVSDRQFALYTRLHRQYNRQYNNQNPQMYPRAVPNRLPKVTL